MENLKNIRSFLETQNPRPKGTCFFKNNLGKKIINKKEVNLSIIIPCYNVEKYVRECIESVLSQKTNFKYEVILINDGSQDNTLNILKEYEDKSNTILINQENKGFSGARNIGLQYVQGEYLMFVDSDDRLSKNAIENLLSVAYKGNYEIVEGRYVLFSEKNILFEEQIDKKKCVKPIQDLKGYPWAKVIKSSLFQNLIYPEGYWFEDTIMGFLVYPRVNKAAKINDIVYEYRQNNLGITITSKKNKKSIDSTWITDLMINSLDDFNIKMTQNIYEKFIHQCWINCQRVFYLNRTIRKNIFIYQSYILKAIGNFEIEDNILLLKKDLLINKKYNLLYILLISYKIYNKLKRI
jgi:glycosyltransferase involved in cell wall biosynthesis